MKGTTRCAMMVALALLSCLAVGGAATAGFSDGNKLFQECQSNDKDEGLCLGYIIGVEDALEGQLFFCVPNEAEAGQVIDVVKRYLLDHPEKRHLPASNLVVDALKEKFPCN